MRAALAGILFVALCAAPGLLLADLLAPSHPALERRILGIATGFALLTIFAYLSTLIGIPWLAPAILAAALLPLWRARRRRPPPPPAESGPRGWKLATVAFVVLCAFVWFAIPMVMRPMPWGWDTSFHAPLVEIIRSEGSFPSTWSPYEPDARFNYPAGLHADMAFLGELTGLPSDTVITVSFLLLGALLLLVVLALGRRFGGDWRSGAFAVALFGLTDGWGTLSSHGDWGGLSNLGGLVLMSSFMLSLARPSRGTTILAALAAVATAFVHHLSFVLLITVGALLILLEFVSERRLSDVGKRCAIALGLSIATAGTLVLANPSGRYELGEGFRYLDRMVDVAKMVDVMGVPVLLLGSLGLCGTLTTHRTPPDRLLPAWTVGLLGFWILFDIIYRVIVYLTTGENYTAMTSARGLTDAAVPLSVCGGILLSKWADATGRPTLAIWLCVGLLTLICYRAPLSRVRQGASLAPAFAQARELCRVVREKTPANAVLFSPEAGGTIGLWLPYLCVRETNFFAYPGYRATEYLGRKHQIRDPVVFANYVAQSRRRPVYHASRYRGGPGKWVGAGGGWNLFELTP
jgi:hypothetical protein